MIIFLIMKYEWSNGWFFILLYKIVTNIIFNILLYIYIFFTLYIQLYSAPCLVALYAVGLETKKVKKRI